MSPRTTSRPSPASVEFDRHTQTFIVEYLAHWAWSIPDRPAVTFVDYLASREGVTDEVTYGELDQWRRALAVRISDLTEPGDRVAIMAPQRTEYVAGFMACLGTAVIGVPLFAPDLPGQADRLAAVTIDATPKLVLTTSDKRALVAQEAIRAVARWLEAGLDFDIRLEAVKPSRESEASS